MTNEQYFAAEFERLAGASRPRGISPAERRDLVKWLRLEFRRLSRYNGDKHGCCVVDRRRFVVRVRPTMPPHLTQMPLPECLRRPDTEANLARLGLPHAAYKAPPSTNNLVKWPEAGQRVSAKYAGLRATK